MAYNPTNTGANAGANDPSGSGTKNPSESEIAKATFGEPNPAEMRRLAEDLPEKDKVQVAHKKAILANTPQEEAKQHAQIVKLSPDSPETPSGGALLATAGIANDVERGEAYAREKAARRHGYAEDSE